jgi:hypothetical protein
MKKFPFVGTVRGIIDGKHWAAMGMARGLFDFLVERQTDPEGRVNYGHPITYGWMRKEIPNCPPRRTLERRMAILRQHHYVEVLIAENFQGMIVRICRPKKWARQSRLFSSEKTVGNPVQNPVEKLWESCANPVEKLWNQPRPLPPDVAYPPRQMWRGVASRSLICKEEESIEQSQRRPPGRSPVPFYGNGRKTRKEFDVRRETRVGAGPECQPGIPPRLRAGAGGAG